jgi:hypothetical protein
VGRTQPPSVAVVQIPVEDELVRALGLSHVCVSFLC